MLIKSHKGGHNMICPLLSNSEKQVECLEKKCMWFMENPSDTIQDICSIKFIAVNSIKTDKED